MIRFIRDPQPPHNSLYRDGMVRDLGPVLNAQFIASGDAVDVDEPGRLYPAPMVLVAPGGTYQNPADPSVSGDGVAAPSTLDSGSAAYNGATLHLAAAGTLTVGTGWLAVLPAGVVIIVGQSGSATLAFSGAATKENSSGTSASSVTLVAGGVYAWLPSPSGSDKGRLTGGAST